MSVPSNANLKTSKAMPVENYSVVTQSENGTQFSPGMKTIFRVPSHLGYVDFHTSYFLILRLKMEFLKWNLLVLIIQKCLLEHGEF
jgi:hypothetical protein